MSPHADKVSHASLSGIYVKAQELDRGHNVSAAPSCLPPGALGETQSHASADAGSHASDGADGLSRASDGADGLSRASDGADGLSRASDGTGTALDAASGEPSADAETHASADAETHPTASVSGGSGAARSNR